MPQTVIRPDQVQQWDVIQTYDFENGAYEDQYLVERIEPGPLPEFWPGVVTFKVKPVGRETVNIGWLVYSCPTQTWLTVNRALPV